MITPKRHNESVAEQRGTDGCDHDWRYLMGHACLVDVTGTAQAAGFVRTCLRLHENHADNCMTAHGHEHDESCSSSRPGSYGHRCGWVPCDLTSMHRAVCNSWSCGRWEIGSDGKRWDRPWDTASEGEMFYDADRDTAALRIEAPHDGYSSHRCGGCGKLRDASWVSEDEHKQLLAAAKRKGSHRSGRTAVGSEKVPLLEQEADFQKRVEELAEQHGWLFHHCHEPRKCAGGGGFPDLIIVGHGRALAAELKSASGKPSVEQTRWLIEWQKAGFAAYVWQPDDWDDIRTILETAGA